jgi:hypothetical protein
MYSLTSVSGILRAWNSSLSWTYSNAPRMLRVWSVTFNKSKAVVYDLSYNLHSRDYRAHFSLLCVSFSDDLFLSCMHNMQGPFVCGPESCQLFTHRIAFHSYISGKPWCLLIWPPRGPESRHSFTHRIAFHSPIFGKSWCLLIWPTWCPCFTTSIKSSICRCARTLTCSTQSIRGDYFEQLWWNESCVHTELQAIKHEKLFKFLSDFQSGEISVATATQLIT